jgi:hypothetical protein
MRKLIIVLLIATAGCATPRAPEPTKSEIAPAPQMVRVAPMPESPAVKPATLVLQPVSPLPESAPPVSQPFAVRKEEPKHQPTEVRKPGEHEQPPVVASKQPHLTVIEETKRPSPELREKPMLGHRLQTLTALATANDDKLLNVFVGMYWNTVEAIMGADHNPYRKTKITGTDGEAYYVLFYLTREPRPGNPITERMLAPVIFRKGRVVAMGNYRLKKLILNGTLEHRKPALSVK